MDMTSPQTSALVARDAQSLKGIPLNGQGSKIDRAKIHQSALDFESVFMAQMLKPMFDTVEVDETFGGGNAEETWRGLQVEEMAKYMTRHGGIGLAASVEKEMLKLQEAAHGQHG